MKLKKNILVILTSLLLMTSISLPIFSDALPFIESPNNDKYNAVSIVGGIEIEGGGTLIQVKREDGCIDDVVLTPFKYRDNIKNKNSYDQLVAAYESIKNAKTLKDLEPDIEPLANSMGANVEDLSVRYLFDITIYENHRAETHDEKTHGVYVELPVEFEDIEDFICLMVYVNGEWQIVEGVEIDPTNPRRMFIPIITGSGAYALVVANGYNYKEAESDLGYIIHWIILLLSLITTILFIITTNKEDQEYYEDKDEKEKNIKAIKLIRILILTIDVLLSLFLYVFFRHSEIDIIALLINYTLVLLAYLMSKKDQDEDEI